MEFRNHSNKRDVTEKPTSRELIKQINKMKKQLFTIMLVLVAFTINAQTEQGKWMVSGATGLQFGSMTTKQVYDGYSDDKAKTSIFSLMPSINYFVMDNLAVGLGLNYSSSTVKYDGDKDTTSSTMFIPNAVYFFPVDGNVKPFAQIGAGYASMVEEYSGSGYSGEEKYAGFVYNLGGGVAYFVQENVSFNFGLSYTGGSLEHDTDSNYEIEQSNFAANIGISVFF